MTQTRSSARHALPQRGRDVLAGLLLSLGLLACRTPPTQVVVRLASDIDHLVAVSLTIQDDDDEVVRMVELPSEALAEILPGEGFQEIGTFGIVPRDGDSTRRFRVAARVEGRTAAGGELLDFETSARSSFIDEQTIRLDVFLAKRCLTAVEECEPGFTCGVEACVPEEVDPRLLPRLDDPVFRDPRGLDGGLTDGGARDGGPDANEDGGVPQDTAPDTATSDIAAPELRYPFHGYREIGESVELVWANVAEATEYELRMEGGPVLRVPAAGGALTRVTVSRSRGTYRWSVASCDAAGCGFGSPERYLHAQRPRCDLDGDGDSEIVVSWIGSPDGTWIFSNGVAERLAVGGPVACADLDGDGDDEVVVGRARVDWVGGAPVVDAMWLPEDPTAVAAGDVDADGRDDLLLGYADRGEAQFWVNGEAGRLVSGVAGAAGSDVALADTDGDGLLDGVISQASGNYDAPGPAQAILIARWAGGMRRIDPPATSHALALFGYRVSGTGPSPDGFEGIAATAPLERGAGGTGSLTPGALYLFEGSTAPAGSPQIESPDTEFSNFPSDVVHAQSGRRAVLAGFGEFERHVPEGAGAHQGHVLRYDCNPDCVVSPRPPTPPLDDAYFGDVVAGDLDLDADGTVDRVAVAPYRNVADPMRVFTGTGTSDWTERDTIDVGVVRVWLP